MPSGEGGYGAWQRFSPSTVSPRQSGLHGTISLALNAMLP
jgi:hypothetical protein